MLRQMAVWTCSAVMLVGVSAGAGSAADTPEELKQLDKLEGYEQLPEEKTIKKELTDVPDQPIETIIVWSEAKPSSGTAPLTVAFSADPPHGVTSPTFAWQFGDGGTATGAMASHTFAKPGLYKVILKVTSPGGDLGQDEHRIKVTP